MQAPVTQFQNTVKATGKAAVMGHQDQAGRLGSIEFQHLLEHHSGGLFVEVAGGFVTEDTGWIVDRARATAAR